MSKGWALGGYTFCEYKCTMHIFGPGESLSEVLSLKQRLDLHASLHLRALSKGVFPFPSLKSGSGLCLKGFKLRCLQFYLGQNFQDYYLIMTRSMAGRPIQAALTLVNIRAFVKEELHHLPAVPGCTQLYQAVPGCTRQYQAVP